jgi:hypothetical protein
MDDPRGLVFDKGHRGIVAESGRGPEGLPGQVLLFELPLLRFEFRQYVLLERLRVAREE